MKRRSPLLVAMFSAATLGIYYSYWLYNTWQELIDMGYEVPSPIISIALHLFSIFNIAFFVSPLGKSFDVTANVTALVTLVLTIGALAVISITYWFSKFSPVMKNLFPSDTLSVFDFPAILIFHYFLLFFVWAGLAQNKLNKLNLTS